MFIAGYGHLLKTFYHRLSFSFSFSFFPAVSVALVNVVIIDVFYRTLLTAGRLSTTLIDVSKSSVSPHVRALAGGTNFMFAVLNSHIKQNDSSYSENIMVTMTNYDSR